MGIIGKLVLLVVLIGIILAISIIIIERPDESSLNPVITHKNVTQIRELWNQPIEVSDILFSPDSHYLVAIHSEGIQIYDVQKLNTKPRLLPIQNATAIDFSPDGKWVVIGFDDGSVQILDITTGNIQHTSHKDVEPITLIAYHPSDNLIITGSHEGAVRVLDIASGDELYYPLSGYFTPISALAISPDGKTLAFGNWHGTDTYIFNVQTGKRLHRFLDSSLGIWAIAYSPDGQFIAMATNPRDDFKIIMRDIEAETIIKTFEGHTSAILDIDYNPSGELIVSAGLDSTIRIWDVNKVAELAVLDVQIDISGYVDFSPDGRYIASSSDDGTIRIWGIPSPTP